MLSDGANNYLYDGEGRICAEQSLTTGAMTGDLVKGTTHIIDTILNFKDLLTK